MKKREKVKKRKNRKNRKKLIFSIVNFCILNSKYFLKFINL